MPPLRSGAHNVEIVASRNRAALLPRVDSRVFQTKISGEILDGRPYVENLIHIEAIRILRIIVNTPMRDCESENCVVGFP